MSFTEELAAFRAAHPDIRTVEAFVTDLNGVVRGKRVPIEHIAKAGEGALRLPLSTLGLDIFGQDVPENALALERGDPDGVMLPIAGALAPMRWSEDTAQLACTLVLPDGSACGFDPRAVLASVVARAVALGFTPVVALELEFYLIDPARPAPPPDPLSGTVLARDQVYDLDIARAFEPVLGAIIEAARALGAPAETAICEFGPGQFEINLGHTADALAGADHMIWLKRAIRGTARAQKLDATFMAKPFGAASGSGQHIHVSLMDDDAHNALAGVPGQGVSPRLGQAVAGLVTTMAEATAVFAPHANSYRRFVAGSYAPTSAAWGLDNRSTAVRVPATHGPGARIEHRVAGADANPYLLAAAVIAAMLEGIEATRTPPPPTIAGAPASDDQPLPLNWERAIAAFTESAFIGTWLGQEMQRVFAGIKRQEHATLLAQVPDTEYNAYLRVV